VQPESEIVESYFVGVDSDLEALADLRTMNIQSFTRLRKREIRQVAAVSCDGVLKECSASLIHVLDLPCVKVGVGIRACNIIVNLLEE